MSPKHRKKTLKNISFYFLRHGQTDYNTQRLFTGQHDIPLNPTGIDQAKEAALQLKNSGIQVIASSPLKRALQTANIISQALEVPIVVIDDLKEGNWGILQGKNIDQHNELIDLWVKGHPIKDSESYANFVQRVIRGTNQALTLLDPVLIVAHGGVYDEIIGALKIAEHKIANSIPVLFQPPQNPHEPWSVHPLTEKSHHQIINPALIPEGKTA